jgi:hypothetical protein
MTSVTKDGDFDRSPTNEQAEADADQTAANADQEVSGADQDASDDDQEGAGTDQRASDRDQAASDRQHASLVDPSPADIKDYETSLEDRRTVTLGRQMTRIRRLRTGRDRDAAARQRDRTADERDGRGLARDEHEAGSRSSDADDSTRSWRHPPSRQDLEDGHRRGRDETRRIGGHIHTRLSLLLRPRRAQDGVLPRDEYEFPHVSTDARCDQMAAVGSLRPTAGRAVGRRRGSPRVAVRKPFQVVIGHGARDLVLRALQFDEDKRAAVEGVVELQVDIAGTNAGGVQPDL